MTQQTVADIVQRGTNAARPAATTVVAGTLYYDTTNSQMTRSNGTTWDVVEPTSLSNPMTTAGDIIVADTGGTPLRLAKGADSTVLTVSPSTHLPVWSSSASGAPTTSTYVTTSSDAGLSAEVAIPGLQADANRLNILGGGSTSDGSHEEFDTNTDPLTWTGATPAVHDANTTVNSHYYIKCTTVTDTFGLESWSPAGAFDLRCKLTVGTEDTSNGYNARFFVTDSGNSNRLMMQYGISNTQGTSITAFTFASSAYTQRGVTWLIGSNEVYLRITRDGSNNVSYYWSKNGILWLFVGTVNFSLTVAKRGIGTNAGATNAFYIACDWIRSDV